ncbi:hypothetical protein Tco_0659838 [Tanacetum coccineum]
MFGSSPNILEITLRPPRACTLDKTTMIFKVEADHLIHSVATLLKAVQTVLEKLCNVGIGGGLLDGVAGELVSDGVFVLVGMEVEIMSIGKVGWLVGSVGEECEAVRVSEMEVPWRSILTEMMLYVKDGKVTSMGAVSVLKLCIKVSVIEIRCVAPLSIIQASIRFVIKVAMNLGILRLLNEKIPRTYGSRLFGLWLMSEKMRLMSLSLPVQPSY